MHSLALYFDLEWLIKNQFWCILRHFPLRKKVKITVEKQEHSLCSHMKLTSIVLTVVFPHSTKCMKWTWWGCHVSLQISFSELVNGFQWNLLLKVYCESSQVNFISVCISPVYILLYVMLRSNITNFWKRICCCRQIAAWHKLYIF